MLTSSCKSKGRSLQKWTRDYLLGLFTTLTKDDIRSTSMGASGADVTLSQEAKKWIPYQFECKAHATFAVYKMYEQAGTHGTSEPVLIIKGNHKRPLAVVDAEMFLSLIRDNCQ
jgi:hypothetical protein